MDSEVIDSIIEKKSALKKSREKLEAMQEGAYCMHRSWGFGKIIGYDRAQNRLLINFFGDDRGEHPMDPAFCVDKLDILSDKNIFVQQHESPEKIDELLKKDPIKIVKIILSEQRNQSATAPEIMSTLSRLMGEAKAKKWWTATKKLLVQDPDIGVPAKKSGYFELREDPIKPEEEILEEFYLNKKPLKKILLAEKLYQLSDDVEVIANDLPVILETLTSACKDPLQLTSAQRLHGVWVRNDLARHLHADVEQLEPTSKSLLDEAEDLSELAKELPSSYYKRYLDLISRVYPEKWERIAYDLLWDSDGRFTNECVNFFIEKDLAEGVRDHLVRWLNEQSINGPLLYWIIKNRTSRKYSSLFEGLLNTQLLSCVFTAIDNIALHSDSTRRIPLADLISEDQDIIPELLADADLETARDLAQTLLINQGFDSLTKKSIIARFIRLYPSIQELISGASRVSQKDAGLVVSEESFAARKAEFEELVNVKIPENKKAIGIAREHGDLRENAEYHMAKDDQKVLDARRGELERDLGRAIVTDFKDAKNDEVSIGSVVELIEGSSGKLRKFAILGAWDSAPEKNIVSYKTPLAQKLLGCKQGSEVSIEVDGAKENWTVQSIARWVEVQSVA